MTAVLVCWLGLSAPVAVLIGRCIAAGATSPALPRSTDTKDIPSCLI